MHHILLLSTLQVWSHGGTCVLTQDKFSSTYNGNYISRRLIMDWQTVKRTGSQKHRQKQTYTHTHTISRATWRWVKILLLARSRNTCFIAVLFKLAKKYKKSFFWSLTLFYKNVLWLKHAILWNTNSHGRFTKFCKFTNFCKSFYPLLDLFYNFLLHHKVSLFSLHDIHVAGVRYLDTKSRPVVLIFNYNSICILKTDKFHGIFVKYSNLWIKNILILQINAVIMITLNRKYEYPTVQLFV